MVSLSQAPAPTYHLQRWPSLFTVCVGVMMAFVNASSTISALPSIQDDLHVGGSTLVWVTSSFTLAVVSLVMSAGTVGELVGRRRTYLTGVLLFAVGSLLAFLARDAGVLIAAQALMGVGSAAVLPSGLAIVSTTFHDPQERTGAISIWASCAGLGLAVGPLVAGVLLDTFDWHAVYATNVLLGLVAAALTLVFVTEGKHPTRRLDPVGVVLGTLTVAAATYAIIQGGAVGYAAPRILLAYAVTALALVVFVRVELSHHDPMLDIRLFRSASFSTTMLVSTAAMFGFVGVALLSVLHLERVADLDALETGVRLLPMMGSYVVVSAVAARVVRRVGFTVTLTTGLVVMGAGTLALLWNGAGDSYSHMWPGLLLAGVGAALLVAPSTAAAVNSVATDRAGMASATVNLFRQLGAMLGPAVLGTIATSRFPDLLARQLGDHGVATATAHAVAADVSHGAAPNAGPGVLHALGESVPTAFTAALHGGLLTGGIVLLAMAVPAVLFVRHDR